MSYNNSQESIINTQDISTGFIAFLANGELDEMLSNTPRRVYYNNLLSPEENISVDETRNDVDDQISKDCIHRTNDKPNQVNFWGGEEADDVCLEALEKYIWGEDFAEGDEMLLEACIEYST